jgi:hypothetical protein
VRHSGESREDAHAQLHFDLLLTDDARGAPFTRTPVLHVPRTHGGSTSGAWSQLVLRVIFRDLRLLVHGRDGPLWRCGATVFKPIHIGQREYVHAPTLYATRDRYGCGTNAYREILVSTVLQEFAWYPVRSFTQKQIHMDSTVHPGTGSAAMVAERSQPQAVYWLEQEDAGTPLRRWDGDNWDDLMAQLRAILGNLADYGVVHGNLHLDHLCVNDAGRLSLLDWACCLWRGFALCAAELERLDELLRTDCDAEHFRKSLIGTRFEGRF